MGVGALGGIFSGGLGKILGIGFSVIGQIAQAQSQNAAIAAQQEQQRQFAIQRNEALKLQQESIITKQAQSEEKGARERFAERRRLKTAQATAQAAASAGGVSGVSVDELLDDFALQTSFFIEGSTRQDEFQAQQANLRLRSATQQSQFDIFTNTPPLESPSFAGSALRIGQTIIGGFGK